MLLPYLVLVALLSGAAALGVRCGRAADAGVVVAEALLLARAVVDVVDVARGPRPADAATYLGYVVVSVVLLPLLLARSAGARLRTSETVRTRHTVAAVACVALVVVVVRQTATAAAAA
ncbi:MAG: hypothetical protein ACRCZP_01465 [Phycicoccus sp.]